MEASKRYCLLDFIRGIALISMIIYHGMWDIVYIFGVNIPWYKGDIGYIWQQSICWTFIIVSGFCWSLGKKHLRTGIKIILCSVIISVITIVLMPTDKIVFGILWFIGMAVILMIPIEKILVKINPYWCLGISFLLFLVTKNIPFGYIGIGDLVLFNVPDEMYVNTITACIGFPGKDFFSTDYFPLVPWMFIYIVGYSLYNISNRRNFLKRFKSPIFKPVEWVGKHSLWIYLIHQPLIYAILYLYFKML